jgi:hypothetical protein
LQAVDYPNAEFVLNLSDGEAAEAYVQAAFRCKTGNGQKRMGHVIDYNRDRVLKIVHKQADAHVDDNNGEPSKQEYERLYESFNIVEQVNGHPVPVKMFFEDVMTLFTKGDYSNQVSNWVGNALDVDVIKELEKYYNTDVPQRTSVKIGHKLRINESHSGKTGDKGTTKTLSSVEVILQNIATAVFYLPAFLAATHTPATLSALRKAITMHEFDITTSIDGRFLAEVIDKGLMSKKTWAKLLAEANAKRSDPPILPMENSSKSVPYALAKEMMSKLIYPKESRLLTVCGGVHLVRGNKGDVYITDNHADAAVVRGLKPQVSVVFSRDLEKAIDKELS